MLTYKIPTGELFDAKGTMRCLCYSGDAAHRNNPSSINLKAEGPIPPGFYVMRPPIDTDTHGPAVLWFQPLPTNVMYDRDSFGMHSDAVHRPGTASLGCIVNVKAGDGSQPTSVFRRELWGEGDYLIHAVL